MVWSEVGSGAVAWKATAAARQMAEAPWKAAS